MNMSALAEAEADRALFFYSSYLMALGHQAGLRQRACLTAALIFRRFYSSRSLEAHDPLLLAPTALLVGSKVEECQAAASALERAMPKLRKDLGDETNPYSARDVEACEQVLFEAVMFDAEAPVSCDPHAAIARHLALAMGEGDGAAGGSGESSANVELTATACYLANDICKTALPLSVADDAIGLACVALACRMLRRPLPPPLECPGALLEQVAGAFMQVYRAVADESGLQFGKSCLGLHQRIGASHRDARTRARPAGQRARAR